ncbi:hypothetical protein JK181_10955 [Gluconobacter kondonii]|nr:hypothetical protein [Gluconobacter kondonii]MBS1083985.1 hypothetical protein [Gluconobacter kondonii]
MRAKVSMFAEPRQQESSQLRIDHIDRLFDRYQKVRRALDLVENGLNQPPTETCRSGFSGGKNRLVVQHDIGPASLIRLADERSLSNSARCYGQDHGRIRKSFFHPLVYKPSVHANSKIQQIEIICLGTLGVK